MTISPVTLGQLTDLSADLVGFAADLPGAIKKTDEAVADEVARASRGAASSAGGVAAKSGPAVFAEAGEIGLNLSAYPYAAGAEWGAIRYGQFRSWTGHGEGSGYFVGPTADDPNLSDRLFDERFDDLLEEHDL